MLKRPMAFKYFAHATIIMMRLLAKEMRPMIISSVNARWMSPQAAYSRAIEYALKAKWRDAWCGLSRRADTPRLAGQSTNVPWPYIDIIFYQVFKLKAVVAIEAVHHHAIFHHLIL